MAAATARLRHAPQLTQRPTDALLTPEKRRIRICMVYTGHGVTKATDRLTRVTSHAAQADMFLISATPSIRIPKLRSANVAASPSITAPPGDAHAGIGGRQLAGARKTDHTLGTRGGSEAFA